MSAAGTKNSSFTEEQVSRNLRIKMIWQKKGEDKGLFIRVSHSFEEMAFLNLNFLYETVLKNNRFNMFQLKNNLTIIL